MRSVFIGFGLLFTLLLIAPATAGQSTGLRLTAQASDALVLKCRRDVFHKYGHCHQYADGKRVRRLPRDFVMRQVDHCVANGGRVS